MCAVPSVTGFASCLRQAIKAATIRPFALVLIDPVMEGAAAATKAIRERAASKQPCIVSFSQEPADSFEEKGLYDAHVSWWIYIWESGMLLLIKYML